MNPTLHPLPPEFGPSLWRLALEALENDLDAELPEEKGGAETMEHGGSARWRALRLEHESLRRELEWIEGRAASGQPFVNEMAALFTRVQRHLQAEGEAELSALCRDVPPGD